MAQAAKLGKTEYAAYLTRLITEKHLALQLQTSCEKYK